MNHDKVLKDIDEFLEYNEKKYGLKDPVLNSELQDELDKLNQIVDVKERVAKLVKFARVIKEETELKTWRKYE